MSQHDFDIANQGFAAFRADLNNALKALGSVSSGTEAPTTTYANQLWYETDTNILHIRDEANSAWLDLMTINQTTGSPSFMAGNVGIGTSSPASIVGGTDTSPVLSIGGADSVLTTGDKAGSLSFITNDSSYTGTYADGVTAEIASVATTVSGAAYGLAFYTGTTAGSDRGERARIDASGNLLVGTTSTPSTLTTTSSVVGVGIDPGYVAISRASTGLFVNRLTTDGTLVDFRKNGTTVGGIGVNSTRPYLAGDSSGIAVGGVNGAIFPTDAGGTLADNLYDVGSSSVRWDDIYATNNVIQTSDRNEKQDIEELSEAERRVAVACKGLLRKYRWKDAVAEKGDDARIHFGIIAQDLQAAFAAEGLDAGRYAMFISSTWWEHDGKIYDTAEEAPEGATERTRLGVRYPELLAFIIAVI